MLALSGEEDSLMQEGVRNTGFEPERHTMIIEGRPVQESTSSVIEDEAPPKKGTP